MIRRKGLLPVREQSSQCVSSVIGQLTSRLAVDGFRRSADNAGDGVVFVFWRHSLEWKHHAIRLVHSTQEPRYVGLSLQVFLEDGQEPSLLDSVGVDAHAGRPGGYALPQTSLFLNFACERVTKRILRDLEGALVWFDGFQDPRDCLARLEDGSTVYGKARGTLYQKMKAYLERTIR
jgi:hypothetical protein